MELVYGKPVAINSLAWRAKYGEDGSRLPIPTLPYALRKKMISVAKERGFFADQEPSGIQSDAPEPGGLSGERCAFGGKFRETADFHDVPKISNDGFAGITWLVPGLILKGGVNAVTGNAGVGKSSFATKMGHCIATGKPFLGFPVKQGPVVILDRQNPKSVVMERLVRLGIEPHNDFITFGSWAGDVPDLDSDLLLRAVKNMPGVTLIVDSVENFLPGDENSNHDMGKLMNACRNLANAGGTIIFIHHTGKLPSIRDWFRGAQVFKDLLDYGLYLSNSPRNKDKNDLRVLTLTWAKGRAGSEKPLKFEYRNGEFALPTNSAANDESESFVKRVAEIARKHSPFNGIR